MKNLESQILRFVVELRKKKNIRSKTIASKLNLRPENYSRLEKGKVRLDIDMLIRIAKILNVNVSYLVLGGERLSERKLLKEENNPSLSPARLLVYDARKNIKDMRSVSDRGAGIVPYPRKTVEDKEIMEKLQETIVKLEKVIQSQEQMLQMQQQIILSQEGDKKQLWKLIDQIEGL